MDEDKKSDAQPTHTPFVTPPLTTTLQLPMPREFNGKKYYGTADVAKILGVTQQAVSKWQNELYMGAPLFTADERAHDGRYLYEVERVMQLKAVYRPNWTRGSYQKCRRVLHSTALLEALAVFLREQLQFSRSMI